MYHDLYKEFEWYNEEIKSIYKIVNALLTKKLKKNFSYINFVMVDPEGFQAAIIYRYNLFIDVDVYICADFSDVKYNYNDNFSDVFIHGFRDILRLIGSPLLENKIDSIFPSAKFNHYKVCDTISNNSKI
jgi:hypothetical protein